MAYSLVDGHIYVCTSTSFMASQPTPQRTLLEIRPYPSARFEWKSKDMWNHAPRPSNLRSTVLWYCPVILRRREKIINLFVSCGISNLRQRVWGPMQFLYYNILQQHNLDCPRCSMYRTSSKIWLTFMVKIFHTFGAYGPTPPNVPKKTFVSTQVPDIWGNPPGPERTNKTGVKTMESP